MRYFNPMTKTEALEGFDDLTGCTELEDDNWFFSSREIPEGMRLDVDENERPVLKPSGGSLDEQKVN